MRRIPIALVFLLVLALGAAAALVSARPTSPTSPTSDEGPLPSLTGAPAIGAIPAEINCTFCHQDFDHPCAPDPCNLNAPGGGVEVLDVPSAYVPGQLYPLRVRLWSDSTLAVAEPLWGFEMTAIRTLDGVGAGTWEPASLDTFSVLPGTGFFGTRTYVEQTFLGARAGLHGQVEWLVPWRAPAGAVGDVLFCVAAVAGNGNDEPGAGDFVYTARATSRVGVVATRAVSWSSLKARYR